jgi:hypothetical protein
MPATKPGIFDFPSNPVSKETVVEIERQRDMHPHEGDLENLFQIPEPANQGMLANGQAPPAMQAEQPQPVPPDIPEERPPVLLRRSPRQNPSTRAADAMHTVLSTSDDESEDETGMGEHISRKIRQMLLACPDLDNETISINTVDVHSEISSEYRAKMEKPSVLRIYNIPAQAELADTKPILRKGKKVSFYLPEKAPYIFFPIKG